jgi:hypothetical protein
MRRDEELLLAVPGQELFAVGVGAVLQRRVDDDLVFVWHKTLQLPAREAKAPGFCSSCDRESSRVARGGNGAGGGARRASFLRSSARCNSQHADCSSESRSPAAGGILDVSVADVPFLRDDPIERPCAGRDFVGGEGKEGGELAEALP